MPPHAAPMRTAVRICAFLALVSAVSAAPTGPAKNKSPSRTSRANSTTIRSKNATSNVNSTVAKAPQMEPIPFRPGPNGTGFPDVMTTSQVPTTMPPLAGALTVPAWLNGIQAANGNTVAGNIQSWLSNIVLPLTTRIVGGSTTPRTSTIMGFTIPSWWTEQPFIKVTADVQRPDNTYQYQNAWSVPQNLDLQYRIIGGATVQPSRYPYIASLRDGNGRHFCGGSLVHPRVVLTAGHCLDQADDQLRRPVVHLGRFYNTNPAETDYVSTRCKKTIVHEGWSFTNGKNDIAMCILEDEVTSVSPVQVAQEFLTRQDVTLTVLGWGSTQEGGANSEVLQGVNVHMMDTAGCNVVYSNRITQGNQICAGLPLGGADACQGDSGGPLVRAGTSPASDLLVGIVSWGSGCGEANKPGVYTQIPAYMTWINRQLRTEVGTTLSVPSITPDEGVVTDSGSGDTLSDVSVNDAGAGAGTATTAPATTSVPASSTSAASGNAPQQSGPADVVDSEGHCACSWSRKSGGVNITEVGCRQHNLAQGDPDFFCYTIGGTTCSTARVSNKYGKPSAWRQCNIFMDVNAAAPVSTEGVISSPSPSPPRVQASDGQSTPTSPPPVAPLIGGGAILGGLFEQIASLFGR